MRLRNRFPTNTEVESEALPRATRRSFLKYLVAPHKGATSIAQFSPTGSASGVNVVLVHGISADGSSYSRVIPLLLAAGHTMFATQLPLTTNLADDVTAMLGVLVGHSYGGAVITNAGAGQPNVIGLVYASAIAPDLGEKLGQFQLGPGAANLYPVTYGALPRCAGEGTLLA
jgi:pimeloyl-ACP methyl ester carboxylesterase